MEVDEKINFGLSNEVISSLSRVFANKSKIEEVKIFGSRAKGNYHAGSDIDLSLKGKPITFETILPILNEIDKLELLYKIDVVNYDEITNPDVKEHINRVGKIFWKKSD
jgi:predicted nucleotidyltransferase